MGDPARATDRDRTGHADVEGRAATPGRPVPDRTAHGAGRFHNPAEAYLALSLGWEDSEFTPHMSEIYLVAWLARAIDGYAPATGHGIPEFYIEPIAIPVGAGMCRLGPDGDQLVARYDGLAWQRMEP